MLLALLKLVFFLATAVGLSLIISNGSTKDMEGWNGTYATRAQKATLAIGGIGLFLTVIISQYFAF